MGARFVVRIGRRWRELDLVSGRVSGLGDVSLVRVRRGRLEVVPRAPALRALRTLLTAGSKRSAAKDGPRLSQIRYPVNRRRSKGKLEQQTDGHKKAPPVHTCCQQHHYQCNRDANFNSIQRPPTSTVGVQCSGQAPATKTINTHTDRVTNQTEELHTISQSQRDHGIEKLRNKNHDSDQPRTNDHGERIKRRTLLGRKRQTQESVSSINAVAATSEERRTENSRREPVQAKVLNNLNQESLSSDSELESGIEKNKLQRNKGPGRKGAECRDHGSGGRKALAKKNEQTQEGPCKELVISEETVMLLRGFIERDQRDVFGVDLERYDTDDAYKAQFFYRLNPLVDLERCPQISRMLRERASQADTVSLKDFITNLGLRSVAESSAGPSRYRMRRRSDVTASAARGGARGGRGGGRAQQRDRGLEEKERSNKDNKPTSDHQTKPAPSHTKPNAKDSSRKVLEEVVPVSSNGGERGKKSPSKPATGKLDGTREYSQEEDAFIVRWVRGEGRAARVNGNRLWALLQPQHHAGTGRFRSWHSLRNRYLRYLLPALGRLPLPPAEAARLRAAAATGLLKKGREQPARRNSAFRQPPVRSAWARRPRPPPPPRHTGLTSDTEETQKRALRSGAALPRVPTDTDTDTDTTDTRVRRARRAEPIRYSSESDSAAPRRRATRRSVRNDDTDKEHRHSDNAGRNGETERSGSLHGDADSLLNERRRSGRRDTDKSDRPDDDSGRVAYDGESNKRKRIASRDSDTDSRSNKRRRSRRLDTSARADSGRQNGRTEQTPRKRRSESTDSDTDTPLYSTSYSEKSVDKSDRRRAEETERNESGPRADRSDLSRDKKGRFLRRTDRRNGFVRDGDKNDSIHTVRQRLNADRIMSENYRNSEKSDRNDRHRSGRHEDGRQMPRTRRLFNPNAL